MKASLHHRVLETIEQHGMVRAGDRVAAAVSGGADSVALLLLLDALRSELGIRLLVLHFNHQLRLPDADTDEQFVAELASSRGLEFISDRRDVAAAAREHGWNIEEAARRLRYQFFAKVVDSGSATRVAVAHTADDQAETLVAHILRGTGPAGLAAIYPVVGHVVRPLLDIRRQALRDYLLRGKQSWREDPTNRDTSRLRARIRHILLPQLERDFQPAVVAHLGQLAALAREDESFWAALIADRFQALVERAPDQSLTIRIPDLLVPLPLQRAGASGGSRPSIVEALSKRLVRRIFQQLKAGLSSIRGQLTARHVEQVLHLATVCSSGHRVHLPTGVVVERDFDRIIFSRSALAHGVHKETASAGRPYEYIVELGAARSTTVSIPEIGRRFRLKVIDWPSVASDTRMKAEVLDRDRLRSPLVFRNWRPGDRYRPEGRQRVRKLKRMLAEGRVSLKERAGWPVLTSGGALVWARGLPVAMEVAPKTGTKTGLVIAEERL